MLLNLKSDLWGYHLNWILRLVKRKKHLLWGVGNRCKDGSYILFLDYDDTPIEWVTEEVRLLQKRYPMLIGTAYIFKTRKGYHALFLEKNDLEDVIEMMRITSADKHHRDIPLYYGRRVWVLRGSPKKRETIVYEGAILPLKRETTLGQRSNPHRAYLRMLYNIPRRDFKDGNPFDEEELITLAYYHVADGDE